MKKNLKAGVSKFSHRQPNCCGKSFVGKEILFGGGSGPVELALILTYDNVAGSGVADPSDVSQWNTLFDLPTNGTPFTSVSVVGNVVNLYGGSGITLITPVFNNNDNIISVNDEAGGVVLVDASAFEDCSVLTTVVLNSCLTFVDNALKSCTALTSFSATSATVFALSCFEACTSLVNFVCVTAFDIGERCFRNCTALETCDVRGCNDVRIGTTSGDDLVFDGITGNNFMLTIPVGLMTCDAGNPDGDIVVLQENNTVIIITV